ncbi:MAG: DUF1501 domain-containing protein [Pirellulales bacterium]
MHQPTEQQPNVSRRGFFGSVANGLHGAALASLLSQDMAGGETENFAQTPDRGSLIPDLTPKFPHGESKAKSVIQLFMNGGPSQMDLFDPKEQLAKNHGKSFFGKIAGEVESPQSAGSLMRSWYKFKKRGECGMWVSDALPHIATCVDDIALIRSMHTTNLTHEPALFKIHSGNEMPGLPSLGSWIAYGLGTENQNLPAYIVLDDPKGLPVNHTQSWQAGYLSPVYQGTRFRSTGSPVLNLQRDFEESDQITQLRGELLARLDRVHHDTHSRQPVLGARIASYELAGRMQTAATDALDLSGETKQTLAMYGIDEDATNSYGQRCLYARRLVERGVRFVQLYIEFQIWDNHTGLEKGLKSACVKTDKPIAGLLKDLKQRGLLDSTLVVWGGEFGRLPIAQLPGDKNEKNAGRDHNKNAMVTWMAGGGVKGGITYGATDELGFMAVENTVTVADWHATILHQLGIHHEKLYAQRNGLKERLTGVNEARIIHEILS